MSNLDQRLVDFYDAADKLGRDLALVQAQIFWPYAMQVETAMQHLEDAEGSITRAAIGHPEAAQLHRLNPHFRSMVHSLNFMERPSRQLALRAWRSLVWMGMRSTFVGDRAAKRPATEEVRP